MQRDSGLAAMATMMVPELVVVVARMGVGVLVAHSVCIVIMVVEQSW